MGSVLTVVIDTAPTELELYLSNQQDIPQNVLQDKSNNSPNLRILCRCSNGVWCGKPIIHTYLKTWVVNECEGTSVCFKNLYPLTETHDSSVKETYTKLEKCCSYVTLLVYGKCHQCNKSGIQIPTEVLAEVRHDPLLESFYRAFSNNISEECLRQPAYTEDAAINYDSFKKKASSSSIAKDTVESFGTSSETTVYSERLGFCLCYSIYIFNGVSVSVYTKNRAAIMAAKLDSFLSYHLKHNTLLTSSLFNDVSDSNMCNNESRYAFLSRRCPNKFSSVYMPLPITWLKNSFLLHFSFPYSVYNGQLDVIQKHKSEPVQLELTSHLVPTDHFPYSKSISHQFPRQVIQEPIIHSQISPRTMLGAIAAASPMVAALAISPRGVRTFPIGQLYHGKGGCLSGTSQFQHPFNSFQKHKKDLQLVDQSSSKDNTNDSTHTCQLKSLSINKFNSNIKTIIDPSPLSPLDDNHLIEPIKKKMIPKLLLNPLSLNTCIETAPCPVSKFSIETSPKNHTIQDPVVDSSSIAVTTPSLETPSPIPLLQCNTVHLSSLMNNKKMNTLPLQTLENHTELLGDSVIPQTESNDSLKNDMGIRVPGDNTEYSDHLNTLPSNVIMDLNDHTSNTYNFSPINTKLDCYEKLNSINNTFSSSSSVVHPLSFPFIINKSLHINSQDMIPISTSSRLVPNLCIQQIKESTNHSDVFLPQDSPCSSNRTSMSHCSSFSSSSSSSSFESSDSCLTHSPTVKPSVLQESKLLFTSVDTNKFINKGPPIPGLSRLKLTELIPKVQHDVVTESHQELSVCPVSSDMSFTNHSLTPNSCISSSYNTETHVLSPHLNNNTQSNQIGQTILSHDDIIQQYCRSFLLKQHSLEDEVSSHPIKSHMNTLNEQSFNDDECLSKEHLLEKYRHICSEIVPNGRLYLSGSYISQDVALLRHHGITHIINVAGDTCKNYFRHWISYITFVLQDNRLASEEIYAILFNILQYIQTVLSQNPLNKILVHCREGVSRSATLIIAYLMWKGSLSFSDCLELVRQRRPTCNPNTGFTFVLLRFGKRLQSNTLIRDHPECSMSSEHITDNNNNNDIPTNPIGQSQQPIQSDDYPDITSIIQFMQPCSSTPNGTLSLPLNSISSLSYNQQIPETSHRRHHMSHNVQMNNYSLCERRILRICIHHEHARFLIGLGQHLYESSQQLWMPDFLSVGFDPRFYYIIRDDYNIYLWRGAETVHKELTEYFFKYEFLLHLQTFEGTDIYEWNILFIDDGYEPDFFWEFLYTPSNKSQLMSSNGYEHSTSNHQHTEQMSQSLCQRLVQRHPCLDDSFNLLQTYEIYNFLEYIKRETFPNLSYFDAQGHDSSIYSERSQLSLGNECPLYHIQPNDPSPTFHTRDPKNRLHRFTQNPQLYSQQVSYHLNGGAVDSMIPFQSSQCFVPNNDDSIYNKALHYPSNKKIALGSTVRRRFTVAAPPTHCPKGLSQQSMIVPNTSRLSPQHENDSINQVMTQSLKEYNYMYPLRLLNPSVSPSTGSIRLSPESKSYRSSFKSPLINHAMIRHESRHSLTHSNCSNASLKDISNDSQWNHLHLNFPHYPFEHHEDLHHLNLTDIDTTIYPSNAIVTTDIRSVKVKEGLIDLEPDIPYLYIWPHFKQPIDIFDDEDLLTDSLCIIAQYGTRALLEMLGRRQTASSDSIHHLCPKASLISNTDDPYIILSPNTQSSQSEVFNNNMSEELVERDKEFHNVAQDVSLHFTSTIPTEFIKIPIFFKEKGSLNLIKEQNLSNTAPSQFSRLTLLPMEDTTHTPDGLSRSIEIVPEAISFNRIQSNSQKDEQLRQHISSQSNDSMSRSNASNDIIHEKITSWPIIQSNHHHSWNTTDELSDVVSQIDEVEIVATVTPSILWVWRGNEWLNQTVTSLTDLQLLDQFKSLHGLLPEDRDIIIHWETEGAESDDFQKLLWLN